MSAEMKPTPPFHPLCLSAWSTVKKTFGGDGGTRGRGTGEAEIGEEKGREKGRGEGRSKANK